MKKTVAGILINPGEKFLFHLRDDKPSIPYPNYWALIGGHIEEDETPMQALKREVMEEIGYKIKSPLFIGTFDDLMGDQVYVFKSKIEKKLDEIILTEGQKVEYFNFDEMLNLKMPLMLRYFLIKNREKLFKLF